MYNNLRFYISILMAAFVVVSCSDDLVQEPQDVDFCVRAIWQDGEHGNNARMVSTRALTATDILADGNGDIVISTDDYPATIRLACSDGNTVTLTKGTSLCSTHGGYWQYTPDFQYKINQVQDGNLTFTATATIDSETGAGDQLHGTADKTSISGQHLLLTLHHTQALLRFAFRVVEKYDAIRLIKIKDMHLNDTPCTLADKVLSTDRQFIGYTYVSPEAATYTFRCSFDIYDKHGTTSDHLVKPDVTAENTFSLGKAGSRITELKAGRYYDLNITLNPDSLGILSDHDNGQLTIE